MTAQTINGWLRRLPPWPIYLLGAAWAGYLFWLAATRQLGAEPINRLEREYGQLAIKLIVLGLAVTPLRNWTRISLLKFRRAIGVTAFFFVLAHFSVFVLLDLQSVGRVVEEIVKRPFITVGFAAFVLLIPLAVTSNNLSIRRLGALTWRRVHWLVYPAAILGGVHYLWIAKVVQLEPLLWMAAILGLLASRIDWAGRWQALRVGSSRGDSATR